MPYTIDREALRAVRFLAQGFPPPSKTNVKTTLERTGFVRTLGGVEAYVALHARVPDLKRADVDATIDRVDAQVLPAARGCMYVVPRRDAAACLMLANELGRASRKTEQEKVGIKKGELEKAGKAIADFLAKKGPQTTDALRKGLPEGTVRSLGDLGKKHGVSSTLPPALRLLEFAGTIERTTEGGRLDTERYLWRRAKNNPLEAKDAPKDVLQAKRQIAQAFFRAAGVATARDFSCWAGIGLREAGAIVEDADLVPVTVDGWSEPAFAATDPKKLVARAKDVADVVALLPFEDNLTGLHRGMADLIDEEHRSLEVTVWGMSKKTTLGDAKHSLRVVAAGGRVVGLWEFDPKKKEVVLWTFDERSKALRAKIEEAASDLGGFLANDVGHGRSFSLDTDDALGERADELRQRATRGKRASTKR
jgi:hypothetical protein